MSEEDRRDHEYDDDDDDDDEVEDRDLPAVSSVVAKTAQSSENTAPRRLLSAQQQQRGRRLFAGLMGALKRTSKSAAAAKGAKRFREMDVKVKRAAVEQREAVSAKRQRLLQERQDASRALAALRALQAQEEIVRRSLVFCGRFVR